MTRGAGVRIDIDLAGLEAAVQRLASAADRRMRMALQMIADEVVVHAKQNHDYQDRTGRLTQSIRAEQVEGSFAEGFTISMLAGGMRVQYAAHVEWGTRPHIIRARNARMLRFTMGGRDVFRRSVRHPGTRPYRFMQNALNAKVSRAEELIDSAMELAAEEAGLI